MTKSRRKSSGSNQLPLLPQNHAVLTELCRSAEAVSAATQNMMEALEKGGNVSRAKEVLAPLRQELHKLKALGDQLDALEASWISRIEREFLELEAATREALRIRGWQVEGQWPKLYVERAIAVEFDDRNRS